MAWFDHGTSRIYYEDDGGSGEPVLVIPGLTLSIDDMQPVRQALTGRYRVIAADAPGSGRSEPLPRQYPSSYYHDDARSFLSLFEELGVAPARIVGFSDGGEYALVMAELDPSAVRAIAAWGSAGSIALPKEMVQGFAQVVDAPMPPMQEYSDYLKAAYGADNARLTVQSAARAFEAIINAGGDISRQRAAEISCPVLLITGENDFLAPPPVVSELASAIPNGEFILAQGATHTVHHEQTDWLVKTIVDWLAVH